MSANQTVPRPLFVEITDEAIEPPFPFTDKTTGMQKLIPGKQKAYLHQGATYPVPIEIEVDDTTGPKRPGRYLLAGDCFSAGQYNRPEFNARKMVLVEVDLAIAALSGTEPAKLKAAS